MGGMVARAMAVTGGERSAWWRRSSCAWLRTGQHSGPRRSAPCAPAAAQALNAIVVCAIVKPAEAAAESLDALAPFDPPPISRRGGKVRGSHAPLSAKIGQLKLKVAGEGAWQRVEVRLKPGVDRQALHEWDHVAALLNLPGEPVR